jgi:ABC-type multidrug transport system ATPase subunit
LTNVIETTQLTKCFNGLTAVDKLNINVESGEVFGLGPNGAGKLRPLACRTILKPTSGTAKVNGFDIVKEHTSTQVNRHRFQTA